MITALMLIIELVVGRRICVTYLNSDKKTVFELYEADQDSHRLNLLKSCLLEVDKHGPTAIMAINDRCFLVRFDDTFRITIYG